MNMHGIKLKINNTQIINYIIVIYSHTRGWTRGEHKRHEQAWDGTVSRVYIFIYILLAYILC